MSPVVLVKKKGGGVHFCIDYRGLNRVTTAVAYPMPHLDQTIDKLAGTQWFMALDARSAYWTVEVDFHGPSSTSCFFRTTKSVRMTRWSHELFFMSMNWNISQEHHTMFPIC